MDALDQLRTDHLVEVNAAGPPAAEVEQWDTAALTRDFEVLGFAAPFVVVRRRSTGEKGSLEFTHSPRVYFNWAPGGSEP
jgi:hypothetical protein